MKAFSRSRRCWIAAFIWLIGLIIAAFLAWWNVNASARDAENRLISEAGRTATQLSALLSANPSALSAPAIKALVAATMDDERVYALLVRTNRGISEGARRNYLWEPVPWDDEIAENSVQGMDPIRINGQKAGSVEIWLSPRMNEEEQTLLKHREELRFAAFATLWTLSLLLLLHHFGLWRHLMGRVNPSLPPMRESLPRPVPAPTGPAPIWINPEAGVKFCHTHASWPVISGMFRQTFNRAPALMSSLYADEELPALCHLGRILQQAAPIIGAAPLEQAAAEMQAILNDPENRLAASAVDNCARVLDQTLAALGGDGGAEEYGEKMPQEEA